MKITSLLVVVLIVQLSLAGYFPSVFAQLDGRQAIGADNTQVTSELEVLSGLKPKLLEIMARKGEIDAEGAHGRNQRGYFHVRFQLGFSGLVATGLVKKDPAILEEGIKAIDYAFRFQNPDGTFKLVVPADLANKFPSDEKSREIFQAGCSAFFYSDLGRALLLMQDSSWFQTSPEIEQLRDHLERLRPVIALSLHKLMGQSFLLEATDKLCTNRLFFDASAYYLVGSWLNDQEAIELGVNFIRKALSNQQPDGVFVEKGGYDSSYQTVSLWLALILYLHLGPREDAFKETFWQAIKKGITWEASRIKPSGEISLEGNARVYPGGERFLGKEKKLDPFGVVIVFNYYALISGDSSFDPLAKEAFYYYQNRQNFLAPEAKP